ncbi:MAG TPA: ATP-binding protein [Puia sp.]|jgi:PAS domain S-box-containing protein
MKGAIEKRLTNGVAVAIVSVLVIVVFSIWQYRRIQNGGAIIRHTNLVLYQTQEVLNDEVQYELNVKNFLLTGDSAFLDRAGDSVRFLPSKIATLKQLTADNPRQQVRIDSLLAYITRNRSILENAMILSRAGNFEEAAGLISSEATTGYSYRIQHMLNAMALEERGLLDIRRGNSQNKALQLQWILWALIAAVAILAFVTFRKIRVDLGREKKAREQLRRFNIELKDEVKMQTANLQASEDKYKTLFYKSPLPKWIYDEATLVFLEVNDMAIRSYGYSRDEFLAMTIMDIRPEEDKDRLLKDVEDVRSHPGSYRDSQWRHIKKDGEIIDVDVTAYPINFEGHRARMVVVSDITERRLYEQQLQQLNTDLAKRAGELASSNGELERFAYIASHDLQEPLRMVSSFLQLLQKRYGGHLDEKADQYIHYAVDGAERMKALIMDLLEYSRVGTGKDGFGWIDTAIVLKEVGDIFREKIISARARVDIGEMPVVWGDKVQMTQLFQNLLSNALKYHSDQAPVIRIRTKEEPGCWQFSISDNGIGIDPQFFDKIFIIFQRLHNKSDYSGTGIGLAICKKIVERHGGHIWVESASEKGSTFYFTIIKKS